MAAVLADVRHHQSGLRHRPGASHAPYTADRTHTHTHTHFALLHSIHCLYAMFSLCSLTHSLFPTHDTPPPQTQEEIRALQRLFNSKWQQVGGQQAGGVPRAGGKAGRRGGGARMFGKAVQDALKTWRGIVSTSPS